MDELMREFLIESQDGLDRMERCLTDLESRPQDKELLAEIFRAVHTIKGTTGFLGFSRLERLSHAGENLLGLLRDGKLIASRDVITALLELLDGLQQILKSIEDVGGEGAEAGAEADAELIGKLEQLQMPVSPPKRQKPKRRAAKSRPNDCTAGLSAPIPPAACTAGLPAGCSAACPERIRRVHVRAGHAQVQTEVPPVSAPPVETPKQEESRPETATAPAAGVASQATEKLIRTTLCNNGTALAGPIAAEMKDPGFSPCYADSHQNSPLGSSSAACSAESTLRVDVTLLNRMMNLVGELVLTRNQVLQATSADPRMTMLSRRLDKVTADLRESVMKARMQPVSNIFSKMPRIVRDLSQTLGRRVRLEMEGQATELDKSLLEAIKDPLTHAVRNALDHGIEPPEVRAAAGKNPEGILTLRAAHEGSHVIVEISDDGAGISVDRIRQKAIERSLITEDHAALMTDRELLQLIFVPGFSTAAQVTHVSGRGVGMDVVRTNVEKIGGKVEIDSRVGKGTTLRMRIPLTLAIIPALIVRSVGQSFALPQGALSELVHVAPEQTAFAIEWIENAPLFRLRGQLLPLVFLDRLLIPGADRRAAATRDNFIAVLDADGRRYGLVVDGLDDPEEIVVKPLSAVLKEIGLYTGATVLGNAELALILDPGAIAAKSGIRVTAEEDAQAGDADADAAATSRADYLLVEVAGRRAAVPLGDVLRIEQVPLSRIEYVGRRPVLNLEGQLLAVEDAGGVIPASGDPATRVIVVVCREGSRQVGIAVDHVLDVARGAELFEAGNDQATRGVTLLHEKVTGVVDLDGVAPLETMAV